MKRWGVVGVVSLVLLVTGSIGFTPAAQGYVSPGSPTGYVNDFANVLTPDEEGLLGEWVEQHEAATTNQVAIVTTPTTAEESVKEYAVRLFKEWGIGAKGKDNGVLLVVAVQDRKLRIEVGYGLESILTDAKSANVISQASPLLKQGS